MEWIYEVYRKLSGSLFLYCTSYFVIRSVKERIPQGILDTDIPYFYDGVKRYDLRYMAASGELIVDSLEDSLYKIKNQIIVDIHSMVDAQYKQYRTKHKKSPKSLCEFAGNNGLEILKNWSLVRQAIAHAKDTNVIPIYSGSEEVFFMGQTLRTNLDPIRFNDEGFLKFFNRDIAYVLMEFDNVLNSRSNQVSLPEKNECESLFFNILIKDEIGNILDEKQAQESFFTPLNFGMLKTMFPKMSFVGNKLVLE